MPRMHGYRGPVTPKVPTYAPLRREVMPQPGFRLSHALLAVACAATLCATLAHSCHGTPSVLDRSMVRPSPYLDRDHAWRP